MVGTLKLIFIILLGTFLLAEVIRINLGNNISIKPVDIAVVVLLLSWITHNFKNLTKNFKSDTLSKSIMSVILIMCISLAINFKNFSGTELLVGLSYIARWVLYSSLYFVVKSFPSKFKKKILYLLLITGSIFTFIGFIQYFLYSNLRNLYYLGWDEHMYRMFSTFLDPNFAGAFFVLYLFLLLSMLLYFFDNKKNKQARIVGLISIFSLISIFLTYSRSALIMLLVSTIIFSILTSKLKWIFGVILISAFFIAISSKNFNIENINLFRIASTEARIDSAKIAIQIIKENYILGVGFNTYRYAQIKYGFRSQVDSNISHADAGTDNSFLFILATTGIVGLIFYLNLLWKIIKISYLNYKQYKNQDFQKYIAVAIISSMGGIMVNSLFINSLFYFGMLIWLWILLGVIAKK